ncbi:MAG: MoaD/ThiS family protein [Candidatus Hermodarchaeota archaeon]
MPLTVKFYGDLREKIPQINNIGGAPVTLNIPSEEITSVFNILKKFNITINEISHIFINNKYSSIENQVKDGDRIGIFPKRMGIIFMEIMSE